MGLVLFVAIDRATRLMFYYVYENKTADSSIDFIKKCKEFFPMKITHMLTDNGLEFTDRFVAKGKRRLVVIISLINGVLRRILIID